MPNTTIVVPAGPNTPAMLAVSDARVDVNGRKRSLRRYGCLSHRGTALCYIASEPGISPGVQQTIQMMPGDCLKITNVGDPVYIVTSSLTPQTFTFTSDVL